MYHNVNSGGRTRSRAAIIADIAFISLWHFAEKRNTWPQQTVVYFDLFRSYLQSTSYIFVETVLHPAVPRRCHGY